MTNVLEPEFEPQREWPEGYDGRVARVGRQAGAERLGATVYEVPTGQSICPYHWHAAEEEMLIVLRGTPVLRTPKGERELAEGEVVAFPIGESGAHKVTNKGDEPARVLMLSEVVEPEFCVYPDSEKIMPEGSGVRAVFRLGDQTDYWDGEVA